MTFRKNNDKVYFKKKPTRLLNQAKLAKNKLIMLMYPELGHHQDLKKEMTDEYAEGKLTGVKSLQGVTTSAPIILSENGIYGTRMNTNGIRTKTNAELKKEKQTILKYLQSTRKKKIYNK